MADEHDNPDRGDEQPQRCALRDKQDHDNLPNQQQTTDTVQLLRADAHQSMNQRSAEATEPGNETPVTRDR